MIDQYAKCLILVIVTGWIIGVRECAAATPFTPRHADPVQEFWRWRAFPELKGQGLSCLAGSGWQFPIWNGQWDPPLRRNELARLSI